MSLNDDLVRRDLRNRLKRYVLTPEFIMDLTSSKKWFRFVGTKMPSDAEVIGVNTSWESKAIHVMVRSTEFDQVPEGEMIPLAECLEVEYKKVTHAED